MAAPYAKDWISDGQILRYGFQETSRATADAWYADIAEVFRSLPEDQPLRLLIDVRMQGAIISAQALIRARQAAEMRPDVWGRTAMLIASPLAAQVISTVIRTGLANDGRQRLVFTDESQAIAWLLETPRR